MNNLKEAVVHFEGKDMLASEWLKLVCGDGGHVAMVDVRADGDQRCDASDMRDDGEIRPCDHCGRTDAGEVQSRTRTSSVYFTSSTSIPNARHRSCNNTGATS